MQTKMRIHNLPGKSNPTTVFEVSGRETKDRGKNHMKTPRATKLLALFLAFVSSVSSGASGAKQMINAGKQSIKRITSALKTNGVSAAVTEGKKASRYYYKSTKRVTKQLFSLRNFLVNIGQAAYSWCKKMLKGGSK